MPTACAPAPSRVRSSVDSATAMPRPTSPITFSAGTRTSSNTGWPVGEPLMPILCSSLGTEKPVRVGVDHERRDALALAVGHGEHHVEVRDRGVGDPVLRAVDDPLVAVLDGGRAHRRRGPSPPRARTGRRPATSRRRRSRAGTSASARRCRAAGSAACPAPAPSGSAPRTRTPWRSPRPPRSASACRCRSRRSSSGKGRPRMSCSASVLRTSHGYSPVRSISAARGAISPATSSRMVCWKSLNSCGSV